MHPLLHAMLCAPQEVIGRQSRGRLDLSVREGSYDHRCDVYSFGILLWEIMHQAIPFGDLGPVDAAWTAHRGVRPPMNLHSERAHFAPIITACWSHSPDQRPALTEVALKLVELENLAMGIGDA